MDAIRLAPAAGEQDIVGRIEAGLAASTSGKKILAFLCSKSAARAMDSTGIKMGRKVTPIRVPCAGTVDLSHIVTAFQKGADGVLVSGCHTGNCASVYGTVLAAGRASQAGLMLEESGIDPGRLLYTTLASNTPGDFVRAVLELESRIGNTGQGGDHV
jgi:coenzyme F420-reducing hydrogenase delta subunit